MSRRVWQIADRARIVVGLVSGIATLVFLVLRAKGVV